MALLKSDASRANRSRTLSHTRKDVTMYNEGFDVLAEHYTGLATVRVQPHETCRHERTRFLRIAAVEKLQCLDCGALDDVAPEG